MLKAYQLTDQPVLVPPLRWALGIQISTEQILCIRKELDRQQGGFLVFGLGFDSQLWMHANAPRRTVFLEDQKAWLERVKASTPALEAHLVRYDTVLPQWREILDRGTHTEPELPAELKARPWSTILVDAPNGFADDHPGRMQSIYTASRLVAPGGSVFVHDCERVVERAYCDGVLGKERLVSKVGNLEHYRF